jgi:dephospho-CoA kinase
MLCVVVVGLPGAGKTEFLKVADEKGFACLEWSSILAADLNLQNIDREKLYEAATCLVKSKGAAYYPKKIYKTLNSLSGVGHVVSGARNPREIEHLRDHYSFFKSVWISSNYLTRFMRCVERKRTDKPKSLEEFIRQDILELAHGLAEIANTADDILFNDGDLETYRKAVFIYLSNVLSKEGDSE